jgi:hypothetical protein
MRLPLSFQRLISSAYCRGLVLHRPCVRELGEAARIHHPVVGSKRAFAVANRVNGNFGSEKRPGGSRMIEADEELEHNLKEIKATCSLFLKETRFLE